MKKIMKKVLSLALVVALAIAPMTVMASGSGTESDPVVLENATTTITTDGTGNPVYYVYNAPVAADYEITVTGTGEDSFGYTIYNPRFGREVETYAYGLTFTVFSEQTDEVKFNVFDYVAEELTVTITMIEGTEVGGGNVGGATGATPDDAIELTESPSYLTIPGGGTTVYYKVAVEEEAAYTLELSNRFGVGFDLYLLNPRFGQYGYYGSADNGVLTVEFSATSTDYIFGIGNPEDMELAVQVTLTKEGGDEAGSENSIDNPEVITEMGTYDSTMPAGAFSYWYQWTAAEAGVLTVTTTNADGYAGFTVNGDWDCVTESLDNGGKVMVAAGDVVVFYVSPAGASTVNMTASFEAGAVIEQDQEGPAEEETNYEMIDVTIEIGADNEIPAPSSWEYTYTVFEFAPTSTGKYTFASNDGLIGIVSYNGMWITVGESTTQVDPTSVTANEVVWSCTDTNQSIWVAVMPNANVATLNVTREELDESGKIDWVVYENKITPPIYKYDGDVDKLLELYVDTADGKVDKAVLGKDGYYHLNSENGEILYVNLNDTLMSFATMATKGSIAAVYQDENNKILEAIDFTEALLEYFGVKDIAELEAKNFGTNPVIYPLTEDLMTMFQKVGETNQWYGEGGFVPGTLEEDAWMFACYYVKGQTTSSTPAPGQTSGAAGGATQAPNTGDNANVAVWAIAMVVAAGAAFVVAESKRRAR